MIVLKIKNLFIMRIITEILSNKKMKSTVLYHSNSSYSLFKIRASYSNFGLSQMTVPLTP